MDEDVTISEPSVVTEVSVIHAVGAEKAPDDTAVETEQASTNIEPPDTAVVKIESREKSEEQVLIIFCHIRHILL